MPLSGPGGVIRINPPRAFTRVSQAAARRLKARASWAASARSAAAR